MPTVTGIISFPNIFTPKAPKGSDVKRYDLTLLFPPGDPHLTALWNEFEAVRKDAYPSGLPVSADRCLMNYKEKYAGKEYYDPALADWWVFTCTAKEESKPPVVDLHHQPVLDPASVPSGTVVHVSAALSAYTKGSGGIGGWLNGVMTTGQLGSLGRLDNKPTVEQMFAGVAGATPPPAGGPSNPHVHGGPPAAPGPTYTAPPAPTPGGPPAPPSAPTPPPAPAAPVKQMTAKANGATYESFVASGWTDVQMIEQGYLLPPGGVTPSFV
jgi:hypothetical protein